ncbi:hypothetical protein BT93_L2782 [Corymbia citriodora subsp. variegata]|uniref:Disease resistance R13L4/SHOC-2-like LRR domain-containing protein n=1 Tax=Corymbia citriodora subsp. variegata TaxID=360336 RepID=A0A8T0CIW2_CORYI|nr:hypothetical protein BT93_L2782 [Corymbia citriodora subsp. variegata]
MQVNNVQALGLNLCYTYLDLILSENIGRFEYQMHLKLNGGTFNGNLANSLTNLSWIFWSQPSPIFLKGVNVHTKYVVFITISHNDLMDDSTLQSIIKMAAKLKVLALESCHGIIRTPDFSGCPNLERLTFEQCSNLRRIDCSISKLKCLIYLRIYDCFALEDLPEEIGDLLNLQHFSVQQCKVKKLPDSIWNCKLLREVHFESRFDDLDSANSWELPSTMGRLQNLEVLIVNNEYLKGQLPFGIGSLPFLRILDLSYSCVSEVPRTINKLPCLQRLKLRECNKIQELPVLPTSLTHLVVSSKLLRATWISPT